MNRFRHFFYLPPAPYWWPPLIVLAALGLILALAQSPLPAAIVYLLLLLMAAFFFTRPRSTSPSRPLLYFLLTTIITISLPYIIDLSLRLSDTSRRLPPNGLIDGTLYTYGHLVTNNSLGFREREFTTPKPPNTYRIMVLGDSMTWGVGVPVSDRYSDILNGLLNQSGQPYQFEVLNFAAQAANLEQELATLQKYIDQVEPDQIVIGFNFDDMGSNDAVVDPERRQLAAQYNQLIDPYFTRLRLYYLSGQTVKAIQQAATLLGFLPDQAVELERQLALQDTNLASFKNSLQSIKKLSDNHRLPPPILIILERGLYTDRPTNYAQPDSALQSIIDQQIMAETSAQAAGFITQHHREAIAATLNNQILAVNSVDNHPSPALHQLYAAKLRDTILANMSYGR